MNQYKEQPKSKDSTTKSQGKKVLLFLTSQRNKGNAKNEEMKTDTQISQTESLVNKGRDLQKFNFGTEKDMMVLEDDGFKFDQFKGKKSTYDEGLYTSKIDHAKLTDDDKKRAAQIEKEINGTVSSNIHLQEERGQIE